MALMPLLTGLTSATGAGISMPFAEALSDTGEITDRMEAPIGRIRKAPLRSRRQRSRQR